MDRTYQRGQRDGQGAHVITLSRVYPHRRAKVWAAFTSAERLSRWFTPVTGELKLGGHYQFQGNAGGTITECVEPERIAATWVMGGESWVELTFADAGQGTRLTLHHTALVDQMPPGFWDKYGPGAVGVGWELGFFGLEVHLDAPEAPRDPKWDTWHETPEGRAAITDGANAWAAAAIAGGEDAAMMQATVPELIAFYTGQPA